MTRADPGMLPAQSAPRPAEPVPRSFRIPSAAAGAVPTFVLVHGVGLSHRFYTGLARILARQGDVVSFDLPGFGMSPTPGQPLTIEDFAAGVVPRLERLRRQSPSGPVIVIGHSMGAQVAVELAVRHPSLVDAVVLVGPVVDPARPTLTQQALALARDAPLELPSTQLQVLYDYARCGPAWFLAASTAMRDYPTHRVIEQLTQPLLVLRGQRDPIAKVSWTRELSTRVPGAIHRTIPGRRHNVPNGDPAGTADPILRFVRALRPTPAGKAG